MTNFSGAFDLSNLTPKTATAAENTVSDWIVRADEKVLRDYLKLSEKVAVLMLITDQSEGSKKVFQLAQAVISNAQGRFAGIEVDLNSSPQLAQAVGVNQAPAMVAILAGQPAPLFSGEVSQDQLVQVLGQVLQLAAQNQITGTVSVGEAAPRTKQLLPEHLAAIEAVDRGDLTDALSKFEKLVVEYPSDQEIRAGLAQVQLLKRLQDGEDAGVLTELFTSVDKVLISGDPANAFELMLTAFAKQIDDRDAIRARLLDLFIVTGDSHPAVLSARQRLASLMF